MKVILLQDIKRLGKRYDIRDLPDGYARNFLIPKKLAAQATSTALSLKSEHEKSENLRHEKYLEIAKKLAGEVFEFRVKAGENKSVFGSVSREDIKKSLKEKGYDVQEVLLSKPIKSLDEHSLEVNIGGGVKIKIKIKVLPRD